MSADVTSILTLRSGITGLGTALTPQRGTWRESCRLLRHDKFAIVDIGVTLANLVVDLLFAILERRVRLGR